MAKLVTEEIMVEIADFLAKGDSLETICKNKRMPSARTVLRAVVENATYFEIYRKGRILQAEHFADKIHDLAQEPLPSDIDARMLNAEVNRRKLYIDTFKWTLARMQPYGIRDKKEDVKQPTKLVIGWANDDDTVTAIEIDPENFDVEKDADGSDKEPTKH